VTDKPFGPAGVKVPVIGQGTWNLPESGAARDEGVRALHRGIELGMTHIDTAEMYGSGAVETILGEALQAVPREKLFVTTKVLPSNASYKGTIAACEASLRRLRMEYVDLYLLHWPGSHPLEETMRALEALVAMGKARFIGVSNFDLDELQEAQGYPRRARSPRPSAWTLRVRGLLCARVQRVANGPSCTGNASSIAAASCGSSVQPDAPAFSSTCSKLDALGIAKTLLLRVRKFKMT
jgi:aryl-alcohol dehydrogenase-like predicted oxidoreductase